MNDSSRKVVNPLFNAAVTGGTLEEFSQNAILLPAKEKTTPPTLNISPDELLSTIIPRSSPQSAELSTPTSSEQQIQQVEQQLPVATVHDQTYPQQDHSQTPLISSQRTSNFSSVFSSFSNILNLGSQNTTKTPQEEVVPSPAGIDSIINQDNSKAEPVPLFPAVSTVLPPKLPSDQGPVNVFRRSGLKRPTYAKVPGLSSSVNNQLPENLPHPQAVPSIPPQQISPVPQSIQPFQTNSPTAVPSASLPPPIQPQQVNSTTTHPQPSASVPPPPIQPQQLNPSISAFPQPSVLVPQQSTPFVPPQPVPSSTPQPIQPQQFNLSAPAHPQTGGPVPQQPVPFVPTQSVPSLSPQPIKPYQFHSSTPTLPQSVSVPQPTVSVSPQPVATFLESFPSAPQQPFATPYQVPSVHHQPTVSTVPAAFPQPLSAFPALNKEPLLHQNLPNQFKPISPPPPSLNVLSQIPQPLPTIPSQPVSQFLQPIKVPSLFSTPLSQHQSPVMDAIPASEALQNNNHLQPPNSYATTNNLPEHNAPINQIYRPVYHHWFFQKEIEGKKLWQPFSMVDSLLLEQAFTSNDLDPDKVIATDGGRYDVNILRRQRIPVYWKGVPSEVRRCSWFHKSSPDGRLVPYEENVATKLEEEFKMAFELNQWHRKVELANGETVVIHGPDVLVLFPPTQTPDAWGNTPNQTRPRVVKRGMDEFDIDEGEPAHVDHILFIVHGIGSVCDFKFRPVEEVVDEFRNIALQLVQSHYRTSCEKGIIHRVEVLPISWHSKLHSDETGIDNQLKSITLESIPKLRDFTNDTLLDILFYTSPVYCQTIISTVGNELNRVYDLFKQRNPSFNGGVSLGGHSLGSLILFDILCHQHPQQEIEEENEEILEEDVFPPQETTKPSPNQRKMSRRISYMMGSVGTGQPQIYYPHLNFEPKTFFALGSPIGMFVIIRGLDTLGENFSLPTCPSFFNIFHPYDPIAYRIESLIRPELGKLKPVLIPHHKGRKRMHLELKETMARVGADLKQKVIESMKSTWNSFYQLALWNKPDQPSLEEEVQKAFQKELENKTDTEEEPTPEVTDIPLGGLNNGRRIDYVLQEAPLEFFNEYIFALTSHVCYWESEDTILLMLKEIYSSMGFSTDNQIPQQTMTIERPTSSPTSLIPNFTNSNNFGMDPTRPMQVSSDLKPPPTAGFVRKT